ncbi:MAG TPA: folate family ECF transporter S component [Firmicutes bacterium]|jgi:ECF transporter S component (folate family)|nr:folate family ECF transporter S component [Bacillota bacterium]
MLQSKQKPKLTTQMLVRMSLLVALNIILDRYLSLRLPMLGVEGLRIGFGAVPVIFAGIFMGPVAGGLVGAVGDIVGFIVAPLGAYVPHFTLTAALRGIIPGLIILLAGRGRREIGIFPLFLAISAVFVVVNILIWPYFMEIVFGPLRAVTVPPKIAEAVVAIPIYTIILFTMGRAMERILDTGMGRKAIHFSGKLW